MDTQTRPLYAVYRQPTPESLPENPMDIRDWQAVQSMRSQRVGHDQATNIQIVWG